MSAAVAIHDHRGFTLVEMLAAILVFGIGLLGIVGLNALSLASSHVAATRSQASDLAENMADRMRANLPAVYAAAGSRYADIAPADNSCRAMYATRVNATPVSCTADEMAADDLIDWSSLVSQTLPGGAGAVCVDSTPEDGTALASNCDDIGNVYAIKVFWSERGAKGQDAQNLRFVLSVQP